MTDKENYTHYLTAKGLSNSTKQVYLQYYEKLNEFFKAGFELDNEIIIRFISLYTNSTARAFLRNYIEFKDLHLKIPRKTGAKPKRKKIIMTEEMLREIAVYMLDRFDNKYGLLLLISYYAGLRRGEATGIKPQDFLWEEWLKDTSKAGSMKLPYDITKGKKERYVKLPSFLMEAIKKYLIDNQDKIDQKDTFIKCSNNCWNKHFRKAVDEVLGKHFVLHDLRSSRATEWNKKGVNIMDIKDRLGHNSIATTQKYIIQDEEEMLERWAEEY